MPTSTKYQKLSPDQLIEHLSNYLVSRFSYSGIALFCRNEKLFEKEMIYGEKSPKSPTVWGGVAYHEALEQYFSAKQEGRELGMDECLSIGFDEIDRIAADKFRLMAKFETVEACQQEAVRILNCCIKNFFAEKKLYEDEIDQILKVEQYAEVFVRMNGVDIPLPLACRFDLICKDKEGKTIVIDHKSVARFTNDDDSQSKFSDQAIMNALACEFSAENSGQVNRVIFIENKIAANRNGDGQLKKFVIEMTKDNRTLYEAKAYEKVRRLIEAVGNPDHIYLMNESDNMCDRAELYDFWIRTQIAEIDAFPQVPLGRRDQIAERQRRIKDTKLQNISPTAVKNFREHTKSFISFSNLSSMTVSEKIEHRLRTHNIPAQVVAEQVGYASTTFLLEIQAGVPIGNVRKYRLDIANALGVEDVRIPKNLVPYNGATYLAVEAPRFFGVGEYREPILYDPSLVKGEKLPVGVMNDGNILHWDMGNHSMPHGVVCGATGSGKSVFLKTMLESFRTAYPKSEIVILDPKYEFKFAENFAEVINEIEEMEVKVEALVREMNRRVKNGEKKMTLVLFDEIADAYAQSAIEEKRRLKLKAQLKEEKKISISKINELDPTENSLKENMMLLLQKGRSSGFRCILATQRATADLLDGNAKVNLPVQICFKVPKEIDSQVVLDESGAELLRGQGDGLMRSPLHPNPIRFQAYFAE